MFSDVEKKIKAKNQVFFNRDSACLKDLRDLIKIQKHRTLVMWALDCAKLTLAEFMAKYPDELRPSVCLKQAESWAKGQIKMPSAKQAILACHQVAKEIAAPEYGAYCHAIGHAGATVHVETHALGLPMYELTGIVLRYNKTDYQAPVYDKLKFYIERLLYWQNQIDNLAGPWAKFLLDDSRPNKEKLLDDKLITKN